MTEYVHVGAHADILASGRVIAPGERATDKDLDLEPDEKKGLHGEDRHIVEAGRLVDMKAFANPKAAGDAA